MQLDAKADGQAERVARSADLPRAHLNQGRGRELEPAAADVVQIVRSNGGSCMAFSVPQNGEFSMGVGRILPALSGKGPAER